MPARPVYFTSGDLARFCACDQKTITNWADRGKIEHFRTVGGHYRFRPAAVLAFLQGQGFDVPAAVTEAQPAQRAA